MKLGWLISMAVCGALAAMCLAGPAGAVDEEPAKPEPLTTSYVCIARDGVMVMEADFKRAKFLALPPQVDLKNCPQAPHIFESDDHTAFLFYFASDRFWSCHVDRSGWLVGETDEFAPSSVERVDATTFRAEYRRSLQDEPSMVQVETWLGTVDGRRVDWKLLEAVKEPWKQRFGGRLVTCGSSCGGRRPEWEDLISARQESAQCALQINNFDATRRRFQMRVCDTTSGVEQWTALDGEPFETDETWREGVIHHFAWDGSDANSVSVLILAATDKQKQGEAEIAYYQWLHYENAGRERNVLFDKEWQGRALLKLLKPIAK